MYTMKCTAWLRILLGTVVLNELIRLASTGFFSTAGYQAKLHYLHDHNFLSASKALLHLGLIATPIAHIAIPVLLLITAIGAIGGMLTRVINPLLCLIFATYFIAHTGVEGTWVFEYALPWAFAMLLYWHEKKAHDHIWSAGDFYGLSPIASALGITAYGITVTSINIGANNMAHGIYLPILVGAAALGLLLLNDITSRRSDAEHDTTAEHQQNLIDQLTITVGIMLASQVHMDYLFKWFTVTGYDNLISTYEHYASISPLVAPALIFIKNHANFFMPLQQALESFLPLCLIALVLRPLAVLFTTGLMLALAIIELGVPSTFPVISPLAHTWAWELMLSALVMVAICAHEWHRFFSTNDYMKRWFGQAMFTGITWKKRISLSILCCITLYFIIYASHNLAKVAFIFSFGSTLTVFLYLMLFHMLDHLKSRYVIYKAKN